MAGRSPRRHSSVQPPSPTWPDRPRATRPQSRKSCAPASWQRQDGTRMRRDAPGGSEEARAVGRCRAGPASPHTQSLRAHACLDADRALASSAPSPRRRPPRRAIGGEERSPRSRRARLGSEHSLAATQKLRPHDLPDPASSEPGTRPDTEPLSITETTQLTGDTAHSRLTRGRARKCCAVAVSGSRQPAKTLHSGRQRAFAECAFQPIFQAEIDQTFFRESLDSTRMPPIVVYISTHIASVSEGAQTKRDVSTTD